MTEIYFSTDVETNGPIPGPNSMLSLGSAAFGSDSTLLGTFSINLRELPGSQPNPETQAWWDTQPSAYAACRENPVDCHNAMVQFSNWVKSFDGTPVFVGFPAGFDFLFVYWYLMYFTGESPFSFSALDGKSYAMALLKKPYRQSTKRNYPRRWLPAGKLHSHIAVEDAVEQGMIFMKMLKENTGP